MVTGSLAEQLESDAIVQVFAGVNFVPGFHLSADEDGVVVSDRDLL